MYLTDYYRFEHLSGAAKTRFDCMASTGGYDELEIRRCRKDTGKTKPGDLVIYCNDLPGTFNLRAQRRADKSLTIGGKNISSIYVHTPNPITGYGDFKGTSDALLFCFRGFNLFGQTIESGGVIEIFIARGQRNSVKSLFTYFEDGQLVEEMKYLRRVANRSRVSKAVRKP